MNTDVPGHRPETLSSNAKERLTPDQVANIDAARNQDRTRLSVIEQTDARRTLLSEFVVDNWDETADTTRCFGIAVDPTFVPDHLVDVLLKIEADTGFDLIADGLAPQDIGLLLEQELATQGTEHVAAQKQDDLSEAAQTTDQLRQSKDAYAALIAEMQGAGRTSAEIIMALKDNSAVPDAERVKLAKFAQIIEIAARVPDDAEVIGGRIAQIDLARGVPDPNTFARTFILHSSSGVSETTQQAVAEALEIERPDLTVSTGSDMADVFESGVGTREVRDPDTGVIRQEPIFLQPGEFAPIRDGQSIGLTERGERALKFDTSVGGFVTPLPENATNEDLTMYGLAGQWLSTLHHVNMAEIFFPGRSALERGGGVLEMRMPDDFDRAQQLSQIFFGGTKGYDGALLDQADLDRVPYLMQFQNAKGDAVVGDVNPEQMLADYKAQGLIDKSGTLIWNRFEAMIEANRNRLWTGEQNFGVAA